MAGAMIAHEPARIDLRVIEDGAVELEARGGGEGARCDETPPTADGRACSRRGGSG